MYWWRRSPGDRWFATHPGAGSWTPPVLGETEPFSEAGGVAGAGAAGRELRRHTGCVWNQWEGSFITVPADGSLHPLPPLPPLTGKVRLRKGACLAPWLVTQRTREPRFHHELDWLCCCFENSLVVSRKGSGKAAPRPGFGNVPRTNLYGIPERP